MVVELVDTLVSEASGLTAVRVQVPLFAPDSRHEQNPDSVKPLGFFFGQIYGHSRTDTRVSMASVTMKTYPERARSLV